MAPQVPLEEVRSGGAAKPANDELRALYRRAFAEFGPLALWSSRPVAHPTIADLLATTESLRTEHAIDAGEISRRLHAALVAADAFVRAMPGGNEGKVFLDAGRPVQPDPAGLEGFVAHAGARHGHWPSSSEITSAMLERFGRGTVQPGDAP